ncbi:MAG: nitroreductase family deazaflavin-dependent oxidoreductase [Acidimicrobiia bacterium]|nr:MAG: nitroreductase family deazaflavin-dependent oxidoreductase [Acidimicrobiia bacterium]
MADFNGQIIDEFRANEGKVGGMFEGAPLLILSTTGAKSGATREAPLMYLNNDDRLFVFASAAGADSHPDWYHNAKANPSVSIEIGTDRFNKTATELDRAERDTVYAEQASRFPQFAEYAAGTDRVIPVFELT